MNTNFKIGDLVCLNKIGKRILPIFYDFVKISEIRTTNAGNEIVAWLDQGGENHEFPAEYFELYKTNVLNSFEVFYNKNIEES